MRRMTATRLLAAMMLLLVPAALTSCKDMSQLAAEIAKAMDDIQAGEEEDAWPRPGRTLTEVLG